MILINLLPHREAERKRRRDRFHRAIAAAVVGGALIAGLLHASQVVRMADQRQRNELLSVGTRQLESQIRDIAAISQEIQALRAREQAVRQLQVDRNLPVAVLGDLAMHLPEGTFLTSVRQEEASVVVVGVAQSSERVSEFMRRLAQEGRHLRRPELIEVVAGTLALGPGDNRRVANFSLRVFLARAVDGPVSPALTPVAATSSASGRSAP